MVTSSEAINCYCEVEEILKRADSGSSTRKDLELLSEATRIALKHMIACKIPITPGNFAVYHKAGLFSLLSRYPFTDALEFVKNQLDRENERYKSAKEIEKRTHEVLDRSADKLTDTIETIKTHDQIIKDCITAIDSGDICSARNALETVTGVNQQLLQELIDARKMMKMLKERLSKIEKQSKTDPLTGLWNKGALYEELRKQLKQLNKGDYVFSVIVADMDDFKMVNDLYGHLAGDEVLIHFAKLLKSDLRMDDFAARFGGEEFVIILPRLTEKESVIVASRLRERLENSIVKFGSEIIKVTASFGVAEAKKGDTPQSLLEKADKALYLAKKEGKNIVRSYRDVVSRRR